jgi:hypothetical protein
MKTKYLPKIIAAAAGIILSIPSLYRLVSAQNVSSAAQESHEPSCTNGRTPRWNGSNDTETTSQQYSSTTVDDEKEIRGSSRYSSIERIEKSILLFLLTNTNTNQVEQG